ncbi:MAG: hypothetical protein IPJ34_22545 [Myxococcales bacterium]|nr:hypothetical protein [Myxococcales bacterium]
MVAWRLLAPVVACAATLGCGSNIRERWEPRSLNQASSRIAASCVRVYRGDLDAVAEGGGQFLGTLDVEGVDTNALGPALRRASFHGGTHCLVTDERESTEVTGAVIQRWSAQTTTVTPMVQHRHAVRLWVFRIAVGAWYDLPPVYQPKYPDQDPDG